MRLGKSEDPTIRRSEPDKSGKITDKKISKEIGEYVDYEEIKKKNS